MYGASNYVTRCWDAESQLRCFFAEQETPRFSRESQILQEPGVSRLLLKAIRFTATRHAGKKIHTMNALNIGKLITDRAYPVDAAFNITCRRDQSWREEAYRSRIVPANMRSKYPPRRGARRGERKRRTRGAGEGKEEDRAAFGFEHAPCSIWLSHVASCRFDSFFPSVASRPASRKRAHFSYFACRRFSAFSSRHTTCVFRPRNGWEKMHGKNRLRFPRSFFTLRNC